MPASLIDSLDPTVAGTAPVLERVSAGPDVHDPGATPTFEERYGVTREVVRRAVQRRLRIKMLAQTGLADELVTSFGRTFTADNAEEIGRALDAERRKLRDRSRLTHSLS